MYGKRLSAFIGLGALLTLLCVAAPAQADEIFFSIKGQKQGLIQGEVTMKGMEGKMKGLKFSSELVSPRDAASGQATGKRQHKPIRISKEVGKASPRLFAALVQNENLPEVIIEFWAPQTKTVGATGAMVKYQTIKLTNAAISAIRRVAEPDPRGQLQTVEEIEFVFQIIELTHLDGGIVAGDAWNAP